MIIASIISSNSYAYSYSGVLVCVEDAWGSGPWRGLFWIFITGGSGVPISSVRIEKTQAAPWEQVPHTWNPEAGRAFQEGEVGGILGYLLQGGAVGGGCSGWGQYSIIKQPFM